MPICKLRYFLRNVMSLLMGVVLCNSYNEISRLLDDYAKCNIASLKYEFAMPFCVICNLSELLIIGD